MGLIESGKSPKPLTALLNISRKYSIWAYQWGLACCAIEMGAAFASALELNDPQVGYDLVMDEQAALALEHGGNPWVVVPDREEALTQATIVRAASRAYLTHYGWVEVEREVSLRARIRNPMTGAYSPASIESVAPSALPRCPR